MTRALADLDPISQFKVPPHSLEAEQSVIGALLLDNAAWERVLDKVSAEDFYRAEHRLLFKHIATLVDADQPADAITVMESLQRSNALDAAGGSAYLTSLVANVPGTSNVQKYAELVRERSVMRRLLGVANQIADSTFNPAGRGAKDLLEEAEKLVFEIAESQGRSTVGFQSVDKL
ncbi:MAG: replicative DNA helicase, partial [Betaproteobacteria bacterium]|nr:replicative DNA helicase [Betaproteobacteria bacterium]